MKKLVYGLVIMFSALCLPAESFNGFHIGLGIGGSGLSGSHVVDQKINSNLNSIKVPLSNNSMHCEALVGYRHNLSDFFLGLELNAGLSALEAETILNSTNNPDLKSVNVRSSHKLAAEFMIGYPFTKQNNAYIKLGLERRDIHQKAKASGVRQDHTKRYNSIAFVPGIGFETEIDSLISVRTEYKVAIHKSKSLTTNNNTATTFKSSPKVHQVTLGLICKL